MFEYEILMIKKIIKYNKINKLLILEDVKKH